MDAKELGKLYADNIKRIRLSKDFSQEKIAEFANVSSAYISEIENQKKVGKFETIAAIANALEVEPYELFLPPKTVVSYHTKCTRELMKRLRTNVGDLLDTLDDYLGK